MTGMNNKKAWYVVVVFWIGMLALSGCPKKAEVSVAPETQREETPAAKATAQPAAETTAQPEQKAEEAKFEDREARERASATRAGLRPVYFDYDQAVIEAEASEIMRTNAEWLKAHPQIKIRIEGNCDERGTIEYNQTLGQRRAANAKKYLTDMGISGHRISLVSYGKEKASCTESTESCWQINRRDDFNVVSE